jgi:hypothetical protein
LKKGSNSPFFVLKNASIPFVQLLPGLCPTVACLNPLNLSDCIKLFAGQEHRVTVKEIFLPGKCRLNDPGTTYPIFLTSRVKMSVPFFAKDKKIKIFSFPV